NGAGNSTAIGVGGAAEQGGDRRVRPAAGGRALYRIAGCSGSRRPTQVDLIPDDRRGAQSCWRGWDCGRGVSRRQRVDLRRRQRTSIDAEIVNLAVEIGVAAELRATDPVVAGGAQAEW